MSTHHPAISLAKNQMDYEQALAYEQGLGSEGDLMNKQGLGLEGEPMCEQGSGSEGEPMYEQGSGSEWDGGCDGDSEEEGWEDIIINPNMKTYKPEQNRLPPTFSGAFSPYFPSYTTAALSLFLARSQLSRCHFNSLLAIIKHPKFSVSDLPKSYKQCRRLLHGLPSLPIFQRNLPVTSDGTRSMIGKIEPTYTHSVADITKRILSTKCIRNQMYFGSGQKVKQSKEFYHGQLWRESALFGDAHVHIHNGGCLILIRLFKVSLY
jgi:hypothetical protein